jgi:hypothetical protein
VILEPLDPNERFRARRRQARRRKRLRRFALIGVLVVAAAAVGLAGRHATTGEGGATKASEPTAAPAAKPAAPKPRPLAFEPRQPPLEIRGVHVTAPLASIPGKLDGYLKLRGLNAIQLDIKDENGEVGFVPSAVPLAKAVGAAKAYYRPKAVAKLARQRGVYLIGRIVCFEDPILSVARPELAIHRPDGSVWKNHAGLGWTNPYDKRVWDYLVDLGEAAARAGFDEIQFDYVRFPTDGDTENLSFPVKTDTPMGWVIPQFVQYASKRLKKLGVRVSVDVFGLAATRDLGIGQRPKRIARYVDAVYPMVYPSHYGSGEYNLPDPNAAPRETVAASLRHFARELEGSKAEIVPWLQDFSYGRTYSLADVQAQIDAAAAAGTRGYLLWNAGGVYTDGALTYQPRR